MASEPIPKERQLQAFRLLRDQARLAHAAGDGLKVNNLCETALQEINRLLKESRLWLSLHELKWVFALGLFWLTYSYTIQRLKEALEQIALSSDEDKDIRKILDCYIFLVEQPLATEDEISSKLDCIRPQGFGESATVELLNLAHHMIELIWFHGCDPDALWIKTIDKWLCDCPQWMQDSGSLKQLKKRLLAQSQLTAPTLGRPPFGDSAAVQLKELDPLAELWLLHLNHQTEMVLDRVRKALPLIRPDSYRWRLYSDFWHINGFFKDDLQADSQGTWLARRHALSARDPFLVFQDRRMLRINGNFKELYRQRDKSPASTRWEILQLGQLQELASLRHWDFGMWRESIRSQSEALLELTQWEKDPEFAKHGLVLGARAGEIKSPRDDMLARSAVDVLEFSNQELLRSLANDLFCTYPNQKYRIVDLFEDIADLLPLDTWGSLAKWTVGCAEEMRKNPAKGSRINTIKHWGKLIALVPEVSPIWSILQPEVERLLSFSPGWCWNETKTLLERWLSRAPKASADHIAEAMIAILGCSQGESYCRASILSAAEKYRGINRVWTQSLLPKVAFTGERLIIARHLDLPESGQIEAVFRSELVASVRVVLAQAAPPVDAKSIQMVRLPSAELITKWTLSELPLFKELIATVDNPLIVESFLPELVQLIQLMVGRGPKRFAEVILPYATRWTLLPPEGRFLFSSSSSLSSVRVKRLGPENFFEMLGWLIFQLPHKIDDKGGSALLTWAGKAMLMNDYRSMPLAFYSYIILASRAEVTMQAPLFLGARSILFILRERARANSVETGQLSVALNYLAGILSSEHGAFVDWDTLNGRGALATLLGIINDSLAGVHHEPNATIRSEMAFLLWKLEQWKALPDPLRLCLNALKEDARAQVRFSSGGRSSVFNENAHR